MNRVTKGKALVGDLQATGTVTAANLTIGSASMIGGVYGATITVGADAGTTAPVTIQLTDEDGNDLAVRGAVMAYISDDANGDSVAGTAPDGVAIGTDGVAIPLVAGKCFLLISEADGDIDLTITENGADVWYLILVMPATGKLVASDAITFTA